MNDRKAMQMALEALEEGVYQAHPLAQRAITALRAAIAAAEQPDLAKVGEVGVWGEPVAWVAPEFWEHLERVNCGTAYRLPGEGRTPLYTHPPKQEPVIDKSAAKRIATQIGWAPKREWQGLTEEALYEIFDAADDGSSPCGVCGACSKCKIELALAEAIEDKLKEKNHE